MSRSDAERFGDILEAAERCRKFQGLIDDEGLAAEAGYDAVLHNLRVLAEAVSKLAPETKDAIPKDLERNNVDSWTVVVRVLLRRCQTCC